VRGLLLVLFGAAVAAAAGVGFLALAGLLPGSGIIEVVLIAALLGQGTVFMEGLRPGVSGTAVNNDPHQIARDRVEALAHGFITYGVAPIFWFLLLGIPGMLVFRAIDVTAVQVGTWSREFKFGWAAARCYDVMTVMPAILGSLVLIVASVFVPQAAPLRGLRVMVRRGGAFPSFAQAWPLAAVAGILGLSLGGPRPRGTDRCQFARQANIPWIGAKDGRARVNEADLRRARLLFGIGVLLVLAAAFFAAIIIAA
jgi:adenosylcobinamide-phosphate synthase